MSKIFDVAILNILWMVFSLPIITLGASTAAVYSASMELIQERSRGTLRSFWSGFLGNWKQGTVVGLSFLLTVGLLMLDLWYFGTVQTFFSGFAQMLICVLLTLVLLVILFTANYAFALQVLFDAPIKQIVADAMILALRHPVRSFAMLIFDLGLIGLSVYALLTMPSLFAVLMLFTVSLGIFANCLLLLPVLKRYMPDNVDDMEQAIKGEK